MIHPNGVVSKKLMGAANTFTTASWTSFLLALIHTLCHTTLEYDHVNELPNAKMPISSIYVHSGSPNSPALHQGSTRNAPTFRTWDSNMTHTYGTAATHDTPSFRYAEYRRRGTGFICVSSAADKTGSPALPSW